MLPIPLVSKSSPFYLAEDPGRVFCRGGALDSSGRPPATSFNSRSYSSTGNASRLEVEATRNPGTRLLTERELVTRLLTMYSSRPAQPSGKGRSIETWRAIPRRYAGLGGILRQRQVPASTAPYHHQIPPSFSPSCSIDPIYLILNPYICLCWPYGFLSPG
ncbi:hypothetical protein P170DRAFT_149832 [Aspergillus steynii IBT 23096]|uniref:Uncharacterized protein n=1 Tax=Aspergillus steynii IBT 23096 TaxID=1392250 RepID=A0A2I2GCJ2_9EURO|nr:uncharacterized protein P170DRAFT_149832 [Aspergillus steynii IBT 23096]PLB50603.1 hypothetical protein P170DRAFT_149832 [Aspergillus steynii IBT 23096]